MRLAVARINAAQCGAIEAAALKYAMPILLAVESSSDLASVALHVITADTAVPPRVFSRAALGVQSHSHSILPMVQAVLAEAGLTLRDCDAIAFGAGPGSFTGVRTACGIAQGLGYGSNRPVIAVDTLMATAQACRDATGATDVLVVLDARMGEVYWGQYRWDPAQERGGWRTVTTARLDTPARVAPVFSGAMPTACGNGFSAHATQFAGCDYAGSARADIMPHATGVALLAQRLFFQGAAVPARDAQPVYLRNDVAQTIAERENNRLEAAR